jgi:hypothetical protein
MVVSLPHINQLKTKMKPARTTTLHYSEVLRQVKAQLIMCKEEYQNENGDITPNYQKIRNLLGCYGEGWSSSNKRYEIDIRIIYPAFVQGCNELKLNLK